MSHPWSGKLAKTIASKKRTRSFWNTFFIIGTTIIVIALSSLFYQLISECVVYESEQIFIDYVDGHLITDVSTFELPDDRKQVVTIDELTATVNKGDKIILTISDISGELIKASYNKKTVYQKTTIDVTTSMIGVSIVVMPVLTFCVFMLVVTNIKNPSKRIDKIQSKFLLRFYDVKKTKKISKDKTDSR